MLLIAVLAGCKGSDAIFGDINNPEVEFELKGGQVPVDVMMNVSSARKTDNTRLLDAVTLLDGNSSNVRYLGSFYLIPYQVRRKITEGDSPLDAPIDNGLNYVNQTTHHYYGGAYSVPRGTASFLCYGRAATYSAIKEVNGSIVTPDLSQRLATSDIYFAPDPIYNNNNEAHATATALATYLTTIATAGGWATDVSTLAYNWQVLFRQFTNQEFSTEPELIAGSSADVQALVTELYRNIYMQEDGTLKFAVLAAIGNTTYATVTWNGTSPTVTLASGLAGFPASIGLPDGAAVLKWNDSNNAFEVQTQATTLTTTVSQNRYAYPADLYFYANSRIATSNRRVESSEYVNKTWEQVLNDLYPNRTDNTVVTATTRGVAIIDPLTYGVGSLRATVQANSATLLDADGQSVTLGAETFPLTGLLVSGQYKQKFDFTPTDDNNEYVIYDHSLPTIYLGTTVSNPFSTLTFQSKDGVPVTLALEFENRSGQTFRGVGGYVYPGTKFYLVGTIDPASAQSGGASDAVGRVFTKRFITQTVLSVSSLEQAYNVVPDLLSARLEVGVKVETEWIESTTSQVILE